MMRFSSVFGLLLLGLALPLQASDFQLAYGQGEYENTTDHRPLELDLSLDAFPVSKSTQAQFTLRYTNGHSDLQRLDRTEWLAGFALKQTNWQAGIQANAYAVRLHAQASLPIDEYWSLRGAVEHQQRFNTDEDHPKLKISQVQFGVEYHWNEDWHSGLRFSSGNFGKRSVADDIQFTLRRSW